MEDTGPGSPSVFMSLKVLWTFARLRDAYESYRKSSVHFFKTEAGFLLREESCGKDDSGLLQHLEMKPAKATVGEDNSVALTSLFHKVASHTWFLYPHFIRTST